MTHSAAVGGAERAQLWAPSLGSVPLTCRCSRAPWTLPKPPPRGLLAGGLGLDSCVYRKEGVETRRGAGRDTGGSPRQPQARWGPRAWKEPWPGRPDCLGGARAFCSRGPTTFWIAGPGVRLAPSTWDWSQQGLA